jgi:enoyl-CoA hydratase
VVTKGAARPEAEALARQLAAFPQAALRGDLLSAIEGASLGFDAAMANELERGRAAFGAEALEGARSFARGAGRHGGTVDPQRKP